MVPSGVRSVLLSAVREEMKDHSLLQDVWSAWRTLMHTTARPQVVAGATALVLGQALQQSSAKSEKDVSSIVSLLTRRAVYAAVLQEQAHAMLVGILTANGGTVTTDGELLPQMFCHICTKILHGWWAQLGG